jgi:SAM-dependent methyltransferase
MAHEAHAEHSHHHVDGDAQTRARWLASEWSFVSSVLPGAPARLVEIGCGPAGGLVPAALAAGYEAVGVDPAAPAGAAYRQVPLEEYESLSNVGAVVAVQSLHHLADLDAGVERIDRMLAADGVVVVTEWAWEHIDEATARWLFARVPATSDSGWAGERQASWRASGLAWAEYRDAWAEEHGLHPWRAVEAALQRRFEPILLERAASLFGDIAEITEQDERAAIAGGEISSTGVHWVGRRAR